MKARDDLLAMVTMLAIVVWAAAVVYGLGTLLARI